MYRSIKDLKGYTLRTPDGAAGHVRDIHFDEQRWVVRHIVVETGNWLAGQPLFIPPEAVQRIDLAGRCLHVSSSLPQLGQAPATDTHRPSSMQHERRQYELFGYPDGGTDTGWGMPRQSIAGETSILPPIPAAISDASPGENTAAAAAPGDPRLGSLREVIGHRVAASDGTIGHVDDFLFDDQAWLLRYVIVDTRNWLPDRPVLLSPAWISGIDWDERLVRVKVCQEAVRTSPPYERGRALVALDEQRVRTHYSRWLLAMAKARDRFVESE